MFYNIFYFLSFLLLFLLKSFGIFPKQCEWLKDRCSSIYLICKELLRLEKLKMLVYHIGLWLSQLNIKCRDLSLKHGEVFMCSICTISWSDDNVLHWIDSRYLILCSRDFHWVCSIFWCWIQIFYYKWLRTIYSLPHKW